MKKTKYKIWPYVTLLIIGLLIMSISILLIIYKPTKDINYFYDKELGLIKIEITSSNWLYKILTLFQQAFVFEKTEANINEVVSLRDDFIVDGSFLNTGEYICYFNSTILRNNIKISESSNYFSHGLAGGEVGWITWTFTPLDIGVYNAKTDYGKCNCNILNLSDCISLNIAYSRLGTNNLTVNSPDQQCTEQPSTGNWVDDRTITGGKIQKRTIKTVSAYPDCQVTNTVEYQTLCTETNYYIKDTTNTIGSGELECEFKQPTLNCTANTSLCVSPKVCDSNGNCVTPNCNGNKNETCANGTVIITHNCINSTLVATGSSCNNQTAQVNQTNQLTCYHIKGLVEQAAVGDSDLCTSKIIDNIGKNCTATNSKYYETQKDCEDANATETPILLYIIVGVVILIFLIIISLIIWRVMKRR